MEKAEILHKDIIAKFNANRKPAKSADADINKAPALKFYIDKAEQVELNYTQYYKGKQKPIIIRYDPKVFWKHALITQ
jgi:hypothetical protein